MGELTILNNMMQTAFSDYAEEHSLQEIGYMFGASKGTVKNWVK